MPHPRKHSNRGQILPESCSVDSSGWRQAQIKSPLTLRVHDPMVLGSPLSIQQEQTICLVNEGRRQTSPLNTNHLNFAESCLFSKVLISIISLRHVEKGFAT